MTPRSMYLQVLRLVGAQALFQTASTLVVTIGALAGAQVAPDPRFATAPIAAMLLGTVLVMAPASHLMTRFGRRNGFLGGTLLGMIGGLIAAWGLHLGSLLVLSLGTMLVGAYSAFAQFYRFAAAEIADDVFRPRAISWVLAGGVVAAIAGPGLALLGGPLLQPTYAGSFVILSLVTVFATMLLSGLASLPDSASAVQGKPRPLLEIMRQPAYAVALFAAATGSGVMVLAMTATPLAMAHHHHGLSQSALVIQAHVLGMFVPSFFTGSLIARFGVGRVMLTGVALLACHVGVSLTGTGVLSFGGALVLLGLAWNFLYVGGTTLLTTAYRPVEKGRAQAANDLIIYSVGLAASLAAGALLATVGWLRLNLLLLPWLLLTALVLLWFRRRRVTN